MSYVTLSFCSVSGILHSEDEQLEKAREILRRLKSEHKRELREMKERFQMTENNLEDEKEKLIMELSRGKSAAVLLIQVSFFFAEILSTTMLCPPLHLTILLDEYNIQVIIYIILMDGVGEFHIEHRDVTFLSSSDSLYITFPKKLWLDFQHALIRDAWVSKGMLM